MTPEEKVIQDILVMLRNSQEQLRESLLEGAPDSFADYKGLQGRYVALIEVEELLKEYRRRFLKQEYGDEPTG